MAAQAIEHLSAKDYAPPQGLVYRDVFSLLPLYQRMAFRADLILVGPKGIGKSLSVAHYAGLNNIPLITFDCSEDVRRSHLLGTLMLRGDTTPFVLGPLTSAFEVANESGRCILLLEECLHPATGVLLPNGQSVSIDRLNVGDDVLSFDQQGQQSVSRIGKTWLNHHSTSITMKVGGVLTTCSPKHPFLTDRGWCYAEEIKPGDRIVRVPGVRVSQKGYALSTSPRANGTRQESSKRPEAAQEDVFSRESTEPFQADERYAHKEVEGPGVPEENHGQTERELKTRPRRSGVESKDGREGRTSIPSLLEESCNQTTQTCRYEEIRGSFERRKSSRKVLEKPSRTRTGFEKVNSLLVKSEVQKEHFGKEKIVPERTPGREVQVHQGRLDLPPTDLPREAGHRTYERTRLGIHRKRDQLDFDPEGKASESGFHGVWEARCAGRRGVLAPSETTQTGNEGVQKRRIPRTASSGEIDTEVPRTGTAVGDGLLEWAVVEAVWHEHRALRLRELSLEGAAHTYIANGLGTHNCNALAPQQQKLLNAATDFRRKIEVPEAKTVFRLRDTAKLWIVGTMNESVYGGVYSLNEDLKSRFRMISLGYMDRAAEEEVLKAVLGNRAASLPVDKVLTLAHETRQQAIDYALSTRDVVQLLEDIDLMGLKDALRVLLGKFETADQKTIRERLRSIFGTI